MPVDTITSREHFLSLRDNWDHVYDVDPEAQLFLSWQWLWHLYERRSDDVLILAYRQASDNPGAQHYFAFMPLRRQLRLSKSQNRFLIVYRLAGNHWADYTGLLCSVEHQSAAIPAFSAYLSTLPWSRLYLECLSMSPTRLKLLTQVFSNARYTIRQRDRRDSADTSDLLRSPRIELPQSFDSYLETCVSSGTRQRIRRFSRKLAADSDLEIRLSTATTRDQDLRCFERLWRRRWASDKGDRVDTLAARYGRIIRQALESGDMRMPVMVHSNKPIGMIACYVDTVKRTVLFYVAARDLSFGKLPVGLLLHINMIQWAIEQGLLYYDLLSGDEPYKYSLGAQDQVLASLLVCTTEQAAPDLPLDVACLDQALLALRKYQRSAAPSVTAKLYAQLRENWPNNVRLARQFDKWAMSAPGRG